MDSRKELFPLELRARSQLLQDEKQMLRGRMALSDVHRAHAGERDLQTSLPPAPETMLTMPFAALKSRPELRAASSEMTRQEATNAVLHRILARGSLGSTV